MSYTGSVLFTEVLNDREFKRKCFGIARNYYTKAMKEDPSKAKLASFPHVFSKTLAR